MLNDKTVVMESIKRNCIEIINIETKKKQIIPHEFYQSPKGFPTSLKLLFFPVTKILCLVESINSQFKVALSQIKATYFDMN